MFPIRDLNPTRIFPIATLALIAANVLAFVLWQPSPTSPEGAEFLYEQAAIACELTTGEPLSEKEFIDRRCVDNDGGTQLFPEKNVWLSAFISMFLHGGIVHIAGNMWFLWIFGNNVEEAYGTPGYLGLYLATGAAATAAFVLLNASSTDPLVGASGAIAGVLGAYLVLFPRHRVLSLVFVFFVPIPAMFFLGFWFLAQLTVIEVGVAWEAHVGGFIAGVLITLPLRESLLNRLRAIHSPRMAMRHTPF